MNAIAFAPDWTARTMVGMTPRRQWFLDLIAELGLIAVVLTVVLLGAYLFGMPRQYNPVNGVSQMVHDPSYRADMMKIFRRQWYITVPLAVGIVSCAIIITAVCIRAALRRRKEVQQ
jgi:hypothetical protein